MQLRIINPESDPSLRSSPFRMTSVPWVRCKIVKRVESFMSALLGKGSAAINKSYKNLTGKERAFRMLVSDSFDHKVRLTLPLVFSAHRDRSEEKIILEKIRYNL